MKIYFLFPDPFLQRQGPKPSGRVHALFNKIGDIILCLLPGLLVLTAGLMFIELWPSMTRLSALVRMLFRILVVWCALAAVVLAVRLKRWFPVVVACIFIPLILLLYFKYM